MRVSYGAPVDVEKVLARLGGFGTDKRETLCVLVRGCGLDMISSRLHEAMLQIEFPAQTTLTERA